MALDLDKKFKVSINGVKTKPLKIFEVNDSFKLAIYKGSISKYDLLIKFIQKDEKRISGWSNVRTPKHIHWTVDMLIKLSHYPDETKKLVNFLIGIWKKTVPNKSAKERNESLDLVEYIKKNRKNITKYAALNNKGEYSIKFILVLAKLLMQQEKNNNRKAYMFLHLLQKLKVGEDIFSVISKATHNGR